MILSVTAFIGPGGGELILIMLVLIMLFGAKDAPRILRSIYAMLDKMQRAAADFRYKIMYGDLLHQNYDPPETEEPYDVEADCGPEETDNVPDDNDPTKGNSSA
ncbi:MAG: hypothetical protein WC959_05045 [Kiritimatiellales bacterium]